MRANRTEHEGVGGKQDGAAVAEIALLDGGVTLVDADIYAQIGHARWRAPLIKGKRYAVAYINGDRVLLHQFVLAVPVGMVRDHISGDSLDNRRANLRVCTPQENHRNRRRPSHNKSGFKGVMAVGGQYRAVIVVNGQQISLGGFSCPVRAAVAYDQAAVAHFGEFAHLNFSPKRDWLLPAPIPSPRSAAAQARGSRDRGAR